MRILMAVLCGVVFGLAGGAGAVPVRVTTGAYQGWSGAYRLSNGLVEAVVVPSIGRVMAYEFAGQPGTNVLYNNPVWAGKPAPPATNARDPRSFPTEWRNYGGDKVWPSEQSQWPSHQPVAWPPDPTIDAGPYKATPVPNGVRLSGPVSPYYAVRHIREITLVPGAAVLTLRDTFVKARSAAGHLAGFPIGIWNISQVHGDATVYLPLNRRGLFPGVGLTSLGDQAVPPPNAVTRGDLVAITRPSDISTKVGVDDGAGWMACLYGGGLLFSEHFSRDPKATYPDKGTNAQVYTNGDNNAAYIEMEVLGPLVTLHAGETLSRTISWRLQRLPKPPTGDAEARAVVLAAMALR